MPRKGEIYLMLIKVKVKVREFVEEQLRKGYIRLLSLSLDNSRTTRYECLGRTQWSSPLD